jgi:hypothetical protein
MGLGRWDEEREEGMDEGSDRNSFYVSYIALLCIIERSFLLLLLVLVSRQPGDMTSPCPEKGLRRAYK